MPPVPVTPPTPYPDGEWRLGSIRLVRPISAGGMARVYEGRLESLAGVVTRVAVKVIHPEHANDEAFQELFIAEARISARLEHQNLVRIQRFDREGELYYLVMEFIDGLTFRKIIGLCRRHGLTLTVPVIAELGRQACEGLHYAHTLTDEAGRPVGLVHRDIKPSNLMLNAHGVAKVLDFGISSAQGYGAAETPGQVRGTWGYMGPEQVDGRAVGAGADIFGLGAVLYELAALEPMFPDKDTATLRARLAADHAALRASELRGPATELGGVLVRALQRDPDARFRTAAHFGRALAALAPDPVGAHEQLVRLVRDLRAMEATEGGAPPPADPGGASRPRTHSTLARGPVPIPPAAPGALPIAAGDAHGVGPRPGARRARPAPPKASALGVTLAAGALFVVSLGVLGWTAWVFVSAPTSAPRPSTSAAAAAMAEPGAPPVAAPAAVLAAPADEPAPPPSAPRGAPPVTPRAPAPVRARPSEAPPAAAASTAPTPDDAAPARIPPRPTAGSPQPEVAPPPAPSPAAPASVAAVAAPVSPPAEVGEGWITVGADVRAQVIVNGRFLKYTPVFQQSVPAGVQNVILVTDDGRRKAFRLTVAAGQTVQKVWSFEKDDWDG